jgi:hypothetical protein
MQVHTATVRGVETAGGYGPPGGAGGPPGGGYGGPPGGGYGGPPGGGYGGPPGGGAPPPPGGYGAPPGGYGGPPGGGYGPPPGTGFGAPGQSAFGPPTGGPRVHPLAIVSLVAGILSMPACCCWFGLSLPLCAMICGYLALLKIRSNPQVYSGKLFCYIGMSCGGLGFLSCLGFNSTDYGNGLLHHYFGRRF